MQGPTAAADGDRRQQQGQPPAQYAEARARSLLSQNTPTIDYKTGVAGKLPSLWQRLKNKGSCTLGPVAQPLHPSIKPNATFEDVYAHGQIFSVWHPLVSSSYGSRHKHVNTISAAAGANAVLIVGPAAASCFLLPVNCL